MTYDWYLLFNIQDFIDSGLVSRSFDVIFPNSLGTQTILVTNGNEFSILFDGIFLPIGLGGSNPFEFDSHAVYYDSDANVWLGILHAS